MTTTLRALRQSPSGKLPRTTVKKAITAVHVLPGSGTGRWVVRKVGLPGLSRYFASKGSAVTFAKNVARSKGSTVLVHKRHVRLKPNASTTVKGHGVYKLLFE